MATRNVGRAPRFFLSNAAGWGGLGGSATLTTSTSAPHHINQEPQIEADDDGLPPLGTQWVAR
jgi:hypothetical protein